MVRRPVYRGCRNWHNRLSARSGLWIPAAARKTWVRSCAPILTFPGRGKENISDKLAAVCYAIAPDHPCHPRRSPDPEPFLRVNTALLTELPPGVGTPPRPGALCVFSLNPACRAPVVAHAQPLTAAIPDGRFSARYPFPGCRLAPRGPCAAWSRGQPGKFDQP